MFCRSFQFRMLSGNPAELAGTLCPRVICHAIVCVCELTYKIQISLRKKCLFLMTFSRCGTST